MSSLNMLCVLISLGMIYGIGRWHYLECQRRRKWESLAEQDRDEIREVAETASSEAASCAAVIDRIGTLEPPRRRPLEVVRDERTGVASWKWK